MERISYLTIPGVEMELRTLRGLAEDFGAEFLVVGGAVRDILLGKGRFRDVDLAMGGEWHGLGEEFARRCGGSFFWLDEERRQARVVVRRPDGTATFDFAPIQGGSVVEDLRSRDFTLNAIALVPEAEGFRLVDPLSGVSDLRGGIIRAPSPQVFEADPLRLLRAFRFAATLGFRIDDATLAWITERAALANGPAAERIRDELFRLLAVPEAAPVLATMAAAGILATVLPSVTPEEMKVRLRMVEKMEETLSLLPSLLSGEAAGLRHDLATATEAEITQGALLKLAALVGEERALTEEAGRLRLGRNSVAFLRRLLAAGRALPLPVSRGDRARFRFFRDHEPAGPAALVRLLAESPEESERCRELALYRRTRYDQTAPDLLLDGPAVMEILCIPPGPAVGSALDLLRAAEAAGMVTDEREARAYILKNVLTTLPPVG